MQTQGIKTDTFSWLRRLFLLAMTAILGLLPYRADGVQLSLPEPVTTETAVLSISVQNNSRRVLSFGVESYNMERQTENGWTPLEMREHWVIEIAVLLYPSQNTEISVDLMELYGHLLDAGTYRLTFYYTAEGKREAIRDQAQLVFDVTNRGGTMP